MFNYILVNFISILTTLQRIKDLRREEQMKKMAVSKLKLEVEQLQSDLLLRAVTSQFTTLYVLPDTATMCSHLHLIKKLVASGKFLLVVCNTGSIVNTFYISLTKFAYSWLLFLISNSVFFWFFQF